MSWEFTQPMKLFDKQQIIFFDIDYTLFDTARFKESGLTIYQLYPEIRQTLEKLSNVSHLGIYSTGEETLQRTKLEKTGILSFFNKDSFFIFADKVSRLDSLIGHGREYKIYLIDDKLDVLYHVQKKYPTIISLWIKRGPYALSQQPIQSYSPDVIISSLEEVIPVITSGV